MQKLRFSDLPLGGFAGLTEKQFVMDERVFSNRKAQGSLNGFGHFVYLADANFLPFGETTMHPHREVDVISVMVNGQISHEGSLEHGQALMAGQSQVQRAGGEGFSHNEINPNGTENQMIQIWVLPEVHGDRAGYQIFEPKMGELQSIYGGKKGETETFDSKQTVAVANLVAKQSVTHQGYAYAYLSKGKGWLNQEPIEARTLVVIDDELTFIAGETSQLIVISNY